MNEHIIPTECHFTARASLAALGVQLTHLDLFGPIRETVLIAQKTVKHTPSDKLYDAFISVLAGAGGLVEINSRLRADPTLQRAFGRRRCAEQSVVQERLYACTAENVTQMEQAMDRIYRLHSQGYQHDYRASLQVLDVEHARPAVWKESRLRYQRLFCQPAQSAGTAIGAGAGKPATRKSSWIGSLAGLFN
jgi:hypothetical protein